VAAGFDAIHGDELEHSLLGAAAARCRASNNACAAHRSRIAGSMFSFFNVGRPGH